MARESQAQPQRSKSGAETSARKPPVFTAERIPNKLHDAGVAFAAYRAGLDRSVLHERLTNSLLGRTRQTIRVSDEDHLAAVASAYAAFILLQREPDFSARIVDLAGKLGVRVTKRSDPLTVIVRAVIEYSEGNSGNGARKHYERDAKAIRYLLSRRVYPNKIHVEAEPKGEGLDAWSRRYRADVRAKADGKISAEPRRRENTRRSPAVPHPKPPTSPSHRALSVASSKGTLTLTTVTPADSRVLDLFLKLIQQRQSQGRKRRWTVEDAVVFSLFQEAVGHQDTPYLGLAERKRQHRLKRDGHLRWS